MVRGTRRGLYVALALVIAALLAWWLWPTGEPSWSLSLEASSPVVTPWTPARLTAHVEPNIAGPHWKWTWQEAGRTFSHEPLATNWKAGKTGPHDVSVTVESPSGTRKTASVAVTVRYRDFMSPIGPQSADALASDPAPADLPFGIEDIWVEKTEVCQGEPTRIRLTPFDERGEQKWLIPQVADSQAWETSFVVPLTQPGLRAVPVQVSDTRRPNTPDSGAATTYVMINVKDCVAPFPMFLEHHVVPPHHDYFAFSVRLLAGPAWVEWNHQSRGAPPDQLTAGRPLPTATAAAYRWSFGDGAEVVTVEPTVNHRYPAEVDRPDEAASMYSVKVVATDASGAVMATAYGAVRIANVLRELKHTSHLVQLATEQTPWSNENADGSRTAEVTLVNIDSAETVTLDGDANVAFKPCDGGAPTNRKLALREIFPSLVLAPKQRLSGKFKLSKTDLASTCWADAEVSGLTTPGSLRALGFFTLDAGKHPTRIYDEEETALMMKVMDLLGHPPAVTDDQIRQLEDEGKIPRGVLLRPHTDVTNETR